MLLTENKIIKFDLSPSNLKIKNLLNQDFLIVEMKAISNANPNRNGSYFTKESMEKAIPTFYNKPILGYFNTDYNDFEAHNSELRYDQELDTLYYDYNYDTAEKPIGLIRQEDKIEIYQDPIDGLYWLKFTCALWCKYNYRSLKRLLKSKNSKKKISVEVEVIDYDVDEYGTEIIKEFIFDGAAILGDSWETGIKNAEMTILDMIKDSVFQKKQKCLSFAYDSLKNENKISNIEPIENEYPKEEISMDKGNQKGDFSQMKDMTYEAKKRLIYNELRRYGYDYVYILDISDSYFVIEDKNIFYRVNYEFDSENNIKIYIEDKKRVVTSWEEYSNNQKKEKNMEKQEFGNDIIENPAGDGLAVVLSKSDDDKAMCKETQAEKEEDCKMSKEEDCKMSKEDSCKETHDCDCDDKDDDKPEDKEDFESEKDKKEDDKDALKDKDDDEEDDELKQQESCKETEAKEESKEDSKEEPKETECKNMEAECTEKETECNDYVSIGDEKCNLSQLYEKFINMSESYSKMLKELEELKEKCSKYEKDAKEQSKNEFVSFANSMIDDENRLYSNEVKENIKKNVFTKCENEEFTNIDEVKKFVISSIGLALYEQKENTTNNKDFSVSINNERQSFKNTDVDKLMDANNKLKYI